MPTTNIIRGDAIDVAQVTTITPASPSISDIFTLTINGKSISYTAVDELVAAVTAGLVALWNASTVAEFAEITAADNGDTLTLTADTAGKPFTVSVTTTDVSAGTVTIVETTKGVAATNETQKIELIGDGPYSGGTFTLTIDPGSGDETTGAIAYNATADTVQTAIEALASFSSGDVTVTGGPGPSTAWFVTFTETYEATEMAEFIIDGTLLTGGGDVVIATTEPGGGDSDAIQAMNINATASSPPPGTYTLLFGGEETATIEPHDTAASIQAKLEALATIGAGNITVTGNQTRSTGGTLAASVYYFTFVNDLGAQSQPLLTSDITLLSGDTSHRHVSAGGIAARNEILVVSDGGADSGSFTLTYNGITSAAITAQTYDISTLETALEPLFGAGNFQFPAYIGWGILEQGIWPIEFIGSLADVDITAITINAGGLNDTVATPNATLLQQGGSGDEVQTVTVYGTGGTFTLSFDGQTTAATAWNASAATLDTNLTALSNITDVTVAGTGTPADPYVVTFTDPGDEDVAQMTSTVSSLTGGGGQVSETVAHFAGTDEIQTVTVDATGGTFTLSFNGQTTAAVDEAALAATLETALELLTTIDGCTVAGSAGGPWTVTFDSAGLGSSDVAIMTGSGANLTGGSAAQTLTLATTTASEGKNHFDTPENWTEGHIGESGEIWWINAGSIALFYGLLQKQTFTAANATDVCTITGTAPIHFVEDQALRVRNTGGGLPGGLAIDTDYYVSDLDRDARTFKLSATRGGSAIDISTDGTGTHTIAAEPARVDIRGQQTEAIGLPERTDTAYYEYRPRFLTFELSTDGEQICDVGDGEGAGSGQINLDFGTAAGTLYVINTAGASETDTKALNVLANNTAFDIFLIDGELAVAGYAGHTSIFRKLTMREGDCLIGGGATFTELDKTGGEIAVDDAALSGVLKLRG